VNGTESPARLVVVGYTVAIAGISTMSGGMVTLTLAHDASWHLPWEPPALVHPCTGADKGMAFSEA
jgi:hypothetical protein